LAADAGRHREERRDEAIQDCGASTVLPASDCFGAFSDAFQ
jgi:hypothetical protein